jgi:hypothetical protein
MRLRALALVLPLACLGAPPCGPGGYGGCAALRSKPATERVAVLLTGLVRTFDIVHPRLRAELVLPLEARGAAVDVFVQTSAASTCGLRDVQNDACPRAAFKGLRSRPDGAAVVAAAANATTSTGRLAAAIERLSRPNLRWRGARARAFWRRARGRSAPPRRLDFGANASIEREVERMAVDAALDIKEKGDLNNNYERHKNELYKAHQYWRMDRARVAALAFAAGDSAGAGGPPGAAWGPPFNYTTMVWLRLDALLNARPGRSNLISLDQDDKRHRSEEETFKYYVPPARGAELPRAGAATLLAVPGSFGRRAAFSNRDYDWCVYGPPAVFAVWTAQWTLADVPCATVWAGCAGPDRSPPPRFPKLSGDPNLWNGDVCTNEPFECRLAAAMDARNFTFEFAKSPRGEPELVAAIVRMPERDPRTHDYDPDMWHTPLGLLGRR